MYTGMQALHLLCILIILSSFLSNICIHLNLPHILALPCNGDPSRKSRTPSATEIAYALILASIWKTTGTNKNSRLLQGHTALGLSAGGCGLPVWCFPPLFCHETREHPQELQPNNHEIFDNLKTYRCNEWHLDRGACLCRLCSSAS